MTYSLVLNSDSDTAGRLIDSSFPTELLLRTIEHLPFDGGSAISALECTHSHLEALLRKYERSIAKSYSRRELPHASSDFPCEPRKRGFRWLKECNKKYDVVDETMNILTCEDNCLAVKRHNLPLVYTGMLLLYHISSIEPHSAKVCFIKSLPLDPLTAMFLAVHNSTLTARYHSHGSIINQQRYGRFMDSNALSLRSDIEFAFSEGCLQLGPPFIHSTLFEHSAAESTLLNIYHEHVINDWDMSTFTEGEIRPPVTQGPLKEPGERSTFTTMLERMSVLVSCPIEEVKTRIEVDSEEVRHRLAWLGLVGRRSLMEGRDAE